MLGGMCWRLLADAESKGSVAANGRHTQVGDPLKFSVFPWLKEVILHIVSAATQTPRGISWQGDFPAFCLCAPLYPSSSADPSHGMLLLQRAIPACPPHPAVPKALQFQPGCPGAFPGSAEQEKLFSLWQEPKQTQGEGKTVQSLLCGSTVCHGIVSIKAKYF